MRTEAATAGRKWLFIGEVKREIGYVTLSPFRALWTRNSAWRTVSTKDSSDHLQASGAAEPPFDDRLRISVLSAKQAYHKILKSDIDNTPKLPYGIWRKPLRNEILMKTHLLPGIAACLVWLALIATSRPIMAQTAPVARDYADILKQFPQQDFLKLRGAHKAETAMAMSRALFPEVGKEGTYRIKGGKVDRHDFPQEGVTGWRILGTDDKVKMGSLTIPVVFHVYVREDPSGMLSKFKRGQTLLVSGTLSRCDITVGDSPALNIDMQASSVSVAK
jgi:hypothetical protein